MVLSEASLGDLNSRLGEKKVKASNFRPNIIISGCDVFAEVTFHLLLSLSLNIFFYSCKAFDSGLDYSKGCIIY
jgi:hypothetical protein